MGFELRAIRCMPQAQPYKIPYMVELIELGDIHRMALSSNSSFSRAGWVICKWGGSCTDLAPTPSVSITIVTERENRQKWTE